MYYPVKTCSMNQGSVIVTVLLQRILWTRQKKRTKS